MDQRSQARTAADLLSFDFLPAVVEAERGDLSPFEQGKLLRASAVDKQALRPLTKLDEQGQGTAFFMTAVLCAKHYFKYEQLPRNGVELFPELTTESGYADFLAMEPGQRLTRYAAGINRVTGRFYASFDESWSQGGFAFVLVPLAEREVVKQYGNRTVTYRPEDESLLTKPLFRYTVYGTQPGTVAFSDMIWPDYSEQP